MTGINTLHEIHTCSQCKNLQKERRTKDGFIFCKTYSRFVRPDSLWSDECYENIRE